MRSASATTSRHAAACHTASGAASGASWSARLVVTLLAAWIAMCCCEKRMFAAMLGVEFPRCADAGANGDASSDGARAAQPSCCGGCCERGEARVPGQDPDSHDGDAPTDDTGDAPGSCCSDGCCAKTAHAPAPDTLSFDCLGAPLPTTLVPQDRGETRARCSRLRMAWLDPDPPPRLTLLVSARLRI